MTISFVITHVSLLIVCEEVCDQGNIFDDGKYIVCGLDSEELKEAAKKSEIVKHLEDRVKSWIKKLSEILKESEQIRRENDSSGELRVFLAQVEMYVINFLIILGPQDELEYWKKRGAQFSQIVSQLQVSEVQMSLNCLLFARSKTVKEWRETDHKITYCYNEAKDNAKFIQALEKNCHSLYLDDPVSLTLLELLLLFISLSLLFHNIYYNLQVKMQDSILGLLQTVRLVHSVSQFYNTSERTSALMVKVSKNSK